MTNLAESKLSEFLTAAAARSPTPGGGAGCVLIAAIGVAFGEMAARYTLPARDGGPEDPSLAPIRSLIEALVSARTELLQLADRDAAAFGAFDVAMKLRKDTPEAIAARQLALADAARAAANVPLEALAVVTRCTKQIEGVAARLNRRLQSDVGVAVLALDAAARGLELNVRANLGSLPAEEAENLRARARAECVETAESSRRVLVVVDAALP